MELERALDIAGKFVAELAARSVVDSLANVARSLQTTVSQPNPQNDQAFGTQLQKLYEILDAAPSNEWPLSERRVLEQLRLSDFTGRGLRAALDKVLIENAITRSVAAQRVNELSTQLQNQYNTASQLVNGFKALGIEARAVAGEECRVILMIPAPEHKDTLEVLDEDLAGFNRLFKVVGEISGEGAASPRVTGLSNGSWIIVLDETLKAAEHLVLMISGIIGIIRGVSILRGKIKGIEEEPDTDQEILTALQKQAEARRERGLGELAKGMAQSAKVDDGRRNQLESEMAINVRFLARKLDRGVRIEILPPDTLPPSAQQNKSPEDIAELQAALAKLKEQALAIAKIADLHEPVLMLPDPEKAPPPPAATKASPPV